MRSRTAIFPLVLKRIEMFFKGAQNVLRPKKKKNDSRFGKKKKERKTKKKKVTISPGERKPVKMLYACKYDGEIFKEITLFL